MWIIDWFRSGFDDPRKLVAQLIGLVPLALSLFIFSINKRKKIILLKGCSDFLWAIHFFVLGEFSGGAINAVNTLRNIVFAQKDKKWANHRWIPLIFILFTTLSALPNFQGFKSLLPLLGSCLAILGFWQTSVTVLRVYNLCGVVLWLIYGVWTVSVPTILCNVFSIISILVGFLKKDSHSNN